MKVRLHQQKIVDDFKYTWVSTIFDTELCLDLSQFQQNIDYRSNSWMFSNASEIRSKLRKHFTEHVRLTLKKYDKMPQEELMALIKALFDKHDTENQGKLDFA